MIQVESERKLVVDLCSGLGGFSEAFVRDHRWKVLRIDNDPKFASVPFTYIRDVRDWQTVVKWIREGWGQPEVILMSPPCQHFSLAIWGRWPRHGIMDALSVVGACLEIVAELKPKFWAMENPKARLRWFVGKPRASVKLKSLGYRSEKPTDIWGTVPLPLLSDVQRRGPGLKGGPRRPEVRALMPIGLSQAVLDAVQSAESEG